jgi:hypothetical protein
MRSGPHEQSPKTAKSARTIYVNGVVEGLLLQARRGFAGVHGRLPEADDYMVINKSGYRFNPSAVGKLFKKFCLQNAFDQSGFMTCGTLRLSWLLKQESR